MHSDEAPPPAKTKPLRSLLVTIAIEGAVEGNALYVLARRSVKLADRGAQALGMDAREEARHVGALFGLAHEIVVDRSSSV